MSRLVTCPHCHKQLKVKQTAAGKCKCPACGGVVDLGASEAAEPEASFDFVDEIVPAANAKGGSTCPNCGQRMGRGATICVACGFDVQRGAMAGANGSGNNIGLKVVAGVGVVAALVVLAILFQIVSGMLGGLDEPTPTKPQRPDRTVAQAERSEPVDEPANKPVSEPAPQPAQPVSIKPMPTDQPLVKLGNVGSGEDAFAKAADRIRKQQQAEAMARQQARQAAEQQRLAEMKAQQEQQARMARQQQANNQNKQNKPLNAQQRAKLQADVDEAIAKAQKFLLDQHVGGHKFSGKHSDEFGNTALVIYALLKSGADPDLPAISLSIEPMMYYASNRPGTERRGTYNAALVMLALDQLRVVRAQQAEEGSYIRPKEQANRDRLRLKYAMRQLLVGLNNNQSSEHSYSYGGGAGRGGHDMSLYQYAMLGMWAANRAEVALRPGWWNAQAEYLMKLQNEDGSWSYKPVKGPTRSMTTAGIGSLAICHLMLNKKRIERQHIEQSPGDDGPPRVVQVAPRTEIEKAIEEGFKWLADKGAADTNPYYLYGLERVCTLTKTHAIGGNDWYEPLARRIVDQQAGDGSWAGHWGPTVSTAWTLLFLSRATEKQFDYEDEFGPTPGDAEIVDVEQSTEAPPAQDQADDAADAPREANAPAEAP